MGRSPKADLTHYMFPLTPARLNMQENEQGAAIFPAAQREGDVHVLKVLGTLQGNPISRELQTTYSTTRESQSSHLQLHALLKSIYLQS